MSMLRSLSDLFAQSTLRRSSPEYPPHVANAKIAKSCQKQTTLFILFHFSDHHEQIHAVALAAALAPSGQVIHHSLHLKHCHTLFLHPSQKQRTVTREALLPHRQTHHHLSMPGISALPSCLEPHLGFTTQITPLTGEIG